MYHTRTFKGGGANYDPRQLTWAVFHCDACGHNEEIDITGRQGTFQFNVPRMCPLCRSFGKEDRIIALRKEIESLTENKANIEVVIGQLTEQLSSLTNNTVTSQV